MGTFGARQGQDPLGSPGPQGGNFFYEIKLGPQGGNYPLGSLGGSYLYFSGSQGGKLICVIKLGPGVPRGIITPWDPWG